MTTFLQPHPEAIALSENLTQLIREEIVASQGSITFARFMELALYAPGLGYYSAGLHKLGREGDFITAPDLSPLFAQCVARQCLQVMAELDQSDILEFGAGSGAFAKDLLLELENLDRLPEHYFIMEVSPDLRDRQMQLFQARCPHLLSRIIWFNQLPEKPLNGIIFANEVLDAMPVHCFKWINDTMLERRVRWEDQFVWCDQPPSIELQAYLNVILKECTLPPRYQSEVSLIQPAWINTLSHLLNRGLILLIDYGYGRQTYYHPERNHGTLTCFHQHHRHDDPLQLVGLQDISAHVDFTHIAESAADAGLNVSGFTTQSAFLLSAGLLDLATRDKSLSEIEKYQQNQAIKRLTLPSEMGEVVKVMALTRQIQTIDSILLGFSLQDRRRELL